MLCDDLEGWDKEGGREVQEEGDIGSLPEKEFRIMIVMMI